MKVLHVSTWKIRCGIAACTESLIDKLDLLGVESHVQAISPYDIQSMLDEDFAALARDVAGQAAGYDLVHVQHEFGFFGSKYPRSIRNFGRLLSALRKAGRPVVVTFHTDPHFTLRVPASKQAVKETILNRIWWWHVARRFRGRKGCHALVHTARGRQLLVQTGLASRNTTAVPMGHEPRPARFDEDQKRRAKARLGISHKSVLLSMFGFIAAYKGHRVAVEALRCLPKKYVLAVIGGRHPSAGGDDTMDQILHAWRDQDPKRLIITGFAERSTIDLYQAATDICLAPYLPGFLSASAALTWALTSARPVIASGIPVFEDIRRHGDCLLTVTPGAAAELAWTIESLAADPQMQARLVRNAQAYAEANSWAIAAECNLRVYREMLSRWQSGPLSFVKRRLPAAQKHDAATPDIRPIGGERPLKRAG